MTRESLQVCGGKIVRIGDRVHASYQRWAYSFGSATVESFGESKWINGPAAIVREDDGRISTWCFDRVHLVVIDPFWFEIHPEVSEVSAFERYMRKVADRPAPEETS